MKICKQCGKLFYGEWGSFCSQNHKNKWNWNKIKYGIELEKYERILIIYKRSSSKVQDELIKLVMKLASPKSATARNLGE